MTEEYGKESPEESCAGKDWMSLLASLERDQILDLLSNGFCPNCQLLLENRIHSVVNKKMGEVSFSSDYNCRTGQLESVDAHIMQSSDISMKSIDEKFNQHDCILPETPHRITSIHSSMRGGYSANSWSSRINNKLNSFEHSGSQILFNDEVDGHYSSIHVGLLDERNEHNRVLPVRRKKDFVHIERINGRRTNFLQGLELHTQVFNADEQKAIVDCVYNLQHMGKKDNLEDKDGNPPGIVRGEDVDPLPPLFKQMIRRMINWHILPPSCIPDSCIVNIYDEGDCIPPHIDHHDFVRPFCTVSFLTECNILFGSNIKVKGPGEFSGPVSIPLPVGSVLILNGNAADIAKHCIPGVPERRISITFRKMDNSKLPYNFSHDPELQGIKPHVDSPVSKSQIHQDQPEKPDSFFPAESYFQQNLHESDQLNHDESKNAKRRNGDSFLLEKDDFPPLGSSNSGNLPRGNRQ